jgi:signal peptidase I
MQTHNLDIFIILALSLYTLSRTGLYFMFQKAGLKGWLAFVPVISWWYWIKLVNRPWYYIIYLLIPAVNVVAGFTITIDLLRSFGQFKFWQQCFGVLLPFIYWPYIGTRKEVAYLGASHSEAFKKQYLNKEKGAIREWADALFFAVYVAGMIRGLYVEAYKIPTPSMEGNLMVGDYLFVSRMDYGVRIPMTPVAVPLAHQDLLGMKAYSTLISLPYMRLPGWREVKNNDPVVFNYPMDEGHPIDKQQNYIKRCIGIPGDSLQIINREVYINGKKLKAEGNRQFSYFFRFKEPLSQQIVDHYELYDIYPNTDNPKGFECVLHISEEKFNALKKDAAVDTAYIVAKPGSGTLFPEKPELFNWTLDDFGPIYVPRKGATIPLTPKNFFLYERIIHTYENHPEYDLSPDGTQVLINGTEVAKTYTFEQNYYWMMGDNRHNSLDSRYWGFVPETNIVGPPLFVFFSIRERRILNPEARSFEEWLQSGFGGIRWNRMFMPIH